MLEAKGLHKIYKNGAKELHVLKGIDLKVEKGEMLSIAGPSGAGKSTLLHLLGGLDRPTKGKVFLGGVDLYNIDETKRAEIRNKRIGFVFQFYHLLPEFTALENVMLPALINPVSRPTFGGCPRSPVSGRKRATELLNSVGLKERMLHKPSQLSGGEQQRVAIARALMNEPELIFCDEPTGNLDSGSGKEICRLLGQLNQEKGQTFVIVTHEEKMAKQADRIIHMQDGQLV